MPEQTGKTCWMDLWVWREGPESGQWGWETSLFSSAVFSWPESSGSSVGRTEDHLHGSVAEVNPKWGMLSFSIKMNRWVFHQVLFTIYLLFYIKLSLIGLDEPGMAYMWCLALLNILRLFFFKEKTCWWSEANSTMTSSSISVQQCRQITISNAKQAEQMSPLHLFWSLIQSSVFLSDKSPHCSSDDAFLSWEPWLVLLIRSPLSCSPAVGWSGECETPHCSRGLMPQYAAY